MRSVQRVSESLAVGLMLILGAGYGLGQRNNPFSANPEPSSTQAVKAPQRPTAESRPTIAQSTYKIAAASVASSLKPTEIYKLGVGDVLFVTLANAPNASGYYNVRPDGSIDFPLAGAKTIVVGMTLDEIEDMLARRITIYKNARVYAKVREFASHRISVSGMVQHRGERFLQREAMPLFTIRADVGVDPAATKVAIRRPGMSRPDVYGLDDEATGDVLVYPGSTLEFRADRP